MRLADPLAGGPSGLAAIHRRQVHRPPWPDFGAFEAERYPRAMRRAAAAQWMRRAREEQGSVYEFSLLLGVLCEAQVGVEVQGALARLITDEVRHTELCARMARAVWPEEDGEAEISAWGPPRTSWDPPPRGREEAGQGDAEPLVRWAADAVLTSCCIGETISRPLFEAAATVTTDPVCEEVLRQILRDEHLHAAFGWDALGALWEALSAESRVWLQERLARRLLGFESSCACGIPVERFAGRELVIERGDPARPNLAMLDREQYAGIFYSTLETEVFPRLAAIGLDPARAWASRGSPARARIP